MNKNALWGLLCAVPFVVLNFIVALRIEPLYSFLGSFPEVRNNPLIPLLLLLLFPVGAYVSLRPTVHKSIDGNRTFHITNSVVALLLLSAFFVVFYALGGELYRCEVLRIPNCD